MFGKKKEEAKAVVSSSGSTSGYQSSSVQLIRDGIIEQRTLVSQTTVSSYIYSTRTETGSIKVEKSTSPIYKQSTSQFQLPSIRDDLTQQRDVMSIFKSPTLMPKSASVSEEGYKSPFSRKLPSYSSERREPFTFHKITENPTRFSGNPSYASTHKLSINPPVLHTSGSTQSLPTSSREAVKHNPIVPTYSTNGKKRVIVINNTKFLQESEDRKGSEIDEKDICRLFGDMGMDVVSHRNLKGSAMKDKVKAFSTHKALKNADMAIVVMMSHGTNTDDSGNPVMGNFTQIFGTDGKALVIDEVLELFSAKSCPAMAGKPKIFIFQCCRGNKIETLHVDAGPNKSVIRAHSDMLIAFSTLPGFYSFRDTIKGSWYIQSICATFSKHAKEFDVETLLKIVDEQLSKKHPEYQQTSAYENRGFKRCFLGPK